MAKVLSGEAKTARIYATSFTTYLPMKPIVTREVSVTNILGVVWGARMRELVTAEIVCKDRFDNEIIIREISVEKNFGSSGQPDFHIQKDRYETDRKSPVVSLDDMTFQLLTSGEIVRRARQQRESFARSAKAA